MIKLFLKRPVRQRKGSKLSEFLRSLFCLRNKIEWSLCSGLVIYVFAQVLAAGFVLKPDCRRGEFRYLVDFEDKT